MIMKICGINNFYNRNRVSCQKQSAQEVSQKGEMTPQDIICVRISFKSGCDHSTYGGYRTSFFRDLDTLNTVVNYLEKTFPKGTVILDYACSSGKEALSLNMLFKDRSKYKIKGFDISKNAIDYANKGFCGIYSSEEFLIMPEDSIEDEPKKELSNIFKKFFDETEEGETEPFYFFLKCFGKVKVKESFKDNVSFALGDINDVHKAAKRQKVGAIFFRNAFHQMFYEYFLNDWYYSGDHDAKINDIIRKIYNRLEPGGIFVTGDCYEEHIINAWTSTPQEECREVEIEGKQKRILKKPPIHKALENQGFVPIYSTPGKVGEIPTVWQKPM